MYSVEKALQVLSFRKEPMQLRKLNLFILQKRGHPQVASLQEEVHSFNPFIRDNQKLLKQKLRGEFLARFEGFDALFNATRYLRVS